jgi:hypothetical protein
VFEPSRSRFGTRICQRPDIITQIKCAVIDYPIWKTRSTRKRGQRSGRDQVSFDGVLHQIGIGPGMQYFLDPDLMKGNRGG